MAARHPYGRGDVILIQFPFSSASGQKDRPAIVMSTDIYHDRWDELLVVAITSRPCDLQTANFNIGNPLDFNNLHGCVPISPPFIVSW